MKYILITFLMVNSAFAMTDEDLLALSKAYCEKNVEKACKIVKCAEKPEDCKKILGAPDPIAQMKQKEIIDMCQGRQDCLIGAVEAEKQKALQLSGPLCAAGNQDHCFEKALIEGF